MGSGACRRGSVVQLDLGGVKRLARHDAHRGRRATLLPRPPAKQVTVVAACSAPAIA